MRQPPMSPLTPPCRMKRKLFDFPHLILWGILSVFFVFASLVTLKNISEFRIQYAPSDYFGLALPETNLANVNGDNVAIFVVQRDHVALGTKADFFQADRKPQFLSHEEFLRLNQMYFSYGLDFVGVEFFKEMPAKEVSRFVSKIKSLFRDGIKLTPIDFYSKNEKI